MGISPEQWDSVKELYEALLECAPSQRAAFLRRKTADAAVREEVLRLLAEHENVGSFLSTPPFLDHRLQDAPVEKQFAPDEILAGRFRIIAFLAAGGMGEVYKAEDTRLDRIVVLKILPKGLAEDPQSLERFRREAKAASALSHPNICTVHDFGEDGGRAFIAMEYLEGQTLSARIQKGKIPLDEALKIAIAIVNALGTAHGKGIIHRDLKPGNVMLTNTGTKLLDFGLAEYRLGATTSEAPAMLRTGKTQIVGTLPYMSPEQLQAKEVDARGDIFAFGAVLYEMLSGKRAFQRRSKIDTIVAVDHEEPLPLHEFAKNVPDEVERIIRRCVRKRPEERYASMSEIEQELEAVIAFVSAPAGGINLRFLFRQGTRPGVAIPGMLVLLLFASFFGWWIHRSSRVQWARDHALPQIAQLVDDGKIGEAYTIAVQAERYIPHDPMFVKFWPDISWSASINTKPSGVAVYRRNYNSRVTHGNWSDVRPSMADDSRRQIHSGNSN